MKAKKAKIYDYYLDKIEKAYEDIYMEESINDFCDNDLINGAEQGFMLGYINA